MSAERFASAVIDALRGLPRDQAEVLLADLFKSCERYGAKWGAPVEDQMPDRAEAA